MQKATADRHLANEERSILILNYSNEIPGHNNRSMVPPIIANCGEGKIFQISQFGYSSCGVYGKCSSPVNKA